MTSPSPCWMPGWTASETKSLVGCAIARQSGQVDDQEGRGGHQGVGEGVLSGRSRTAPKGREGDGGGIGDGREEEGGDGGEAGGGGCLMRSGGTSQGGEIRGRARFLCTAAPPPGSPMLDLWVAAW